MAQLGFALFGCGRIGRVHAATLAAHPRARLLRCCDAVADAAAQVAAETGAVACTVEDALADPAVQAVLIASPTATHVPLLIQSVRADRAVLCEKPIDLDLARVDSCWDAIRALSPVVMIGFNRRFDPSFRALHRRLPEIGRLEHLVITSRDPAPPPPAYVAGSGGLFRDMAIHDFDMARMLAGEMVEVQAMGANLIEPGIEAAGDIDAAVVTMRAASGALVQIGNSRRCAYGYDQRIEAFGSAGMLQAHNRHETTVEHWGPAHTRAQDRAQSFFIDRYAEAYRTEISHFIECIQRGTPPAPGFADGRAALALADAAGESLRTGRAVRL